MPSWLKILDEKPDHPMFNMEEAQKLLVDLPQDNPLKALDELTGWLISVKDTPGFQPELRTDIIMLLDETALQFHWELLQRYLAEAQLQDFKSLRMWQGVHAFMKALAEAYALCADEYQQVEKPSPTLKDKMPVACTRLLRAIAEQMKLELMRYVKIEQTVWEQLFRYYNFAASHEFADSVLFAYSKGNPHTSPQREFLRVMLLYTASPDTLAPDQIEVSFRIAARLSSFFDFKDAPEADCSYFVDLAHPSAPMDVNDNLQLTPTMRFFGAVKAVPKLEEIISDSERGQLDPEQRQESEFTPQGKLTVLKHLQIYWSKDHPHRRQERRGISSTIEVIHGFKIISKLVSHAKLDQLAGVSEEEAQMLQEQSQLNLTDADEDIEYVTEIWDVMDASIGGIGCKIPKTAGTWVKIGALCGLKASNSSEWWVAVIRRLQTDPQGKVGAGIEILAKKPLAVWLRSLGRGAELASNWESSSGSFKYTYLPAILMPDDKNSPAQGTMLMESGGYRLDYVYEVLMGEKNNNIKLTDLLAEGADYERIGFQWVNPANPAGT